MPSSSNISNTEEHGRRKSSDKKLNGANFTPETELDDFGLPIRRLTSTSKAHLRQTSGGSNSTKEQTAESQLGQQNVRSTPADPADDAPKSPLNSSKELGTDNRKNSNKEYNTAQATHESKANAEQQSSGAILKTPATPQDANDHTTNASNPSDIAAEHQEITTTNDTKTAPPPAELKEAIREQAENAPVSGHRRGQSSTGAGISEWSHQQLAPKDFVEEEVEEDQWQIMPAYAPYDIYDDNNKLVAREANESEDEAADGGLGGAGKGYTRVQLDEDAQSATSLDENTQYLFKDLSNTSAAGPDDDEARDALSQMKATKDLLTEGQRIAYVGMTRLALSDMLKQCQAMLNKTKGSKKEAALGTEAMKMWGQKMMVRLYSHMDISSAEQVMIEQLSEHGVEPKDLTPTLMQNSRVKNPMAEKDEKDAHPIQISPKQASVSSTTKRSRDSISSLPEEEELASPPPPYVQHEGDDLPEVRTPSQLPNSKNIDIDLRWTVLCDLFLTLVADSIYDARSRVLLERVGQHMDVSWTEICRFEKRVTDALEMQQAAEKENWNEDEHKEARRKQALKKRYMYMGLATVGGSLVIGLSAGLLAPVIGAGLAAGFTTIGVAGTGGFLAGAGGAAIITSTAAASGGVIAVRAANRRTGAVKTFEYRPLHNNKRVNLIVTVSGWMTGKVDDVRLPYSTVDPIMGDIYSVLWEPEMLTSMGDTINILATEALTQGLQQVLGSTILVGLMAALQLPVVLTKLSYLIDNPWTVSLDRANSAGLILADSLIARNLGTRPITLVGYSLGSRMLFSCLKELAKKSAFGIVQNVYLFGSPIVANKDEYLKARTVVAGRFVNGYAKNDWILGYLFRLTSGGISRVAGLAPVEDIPGLENIDVTSLVPGHMSYRTAMPKLLQEVGFIVESLEFTEIEDPDPENHGKRQRELINEIEEARKELEEKEKTKGIKGAFGIFGRKRKAALKKKEWETYQESKEEHDERLEVSHEGNLSPFFDIEAIRRELATEQMEVRELPSTLPPIRLSERLEVKELKSTLPPMKLDLESSMISPRPSLRETKTYDASILANSKSSTIGSSPPLPRLSSDKSHNIDNPSAGSSNTYLREDDIRMTFDDAYRSPAPSSDSFPKSTPAPNLSPPMASSVNRSAALQRPDLKSSVTMPALGLGLEHNAWADEDEEFKEKEIEMTFA